MKYSESQILEFVYKNGDWTVTDGCPCISSVFDENDIYICLYQNNECDDFIEIEVISSKRIENNYEVDFQNNTEFSKIYCLGDDHHDLLKKLYLSNYKLRMTA